MIYKNYKFTVPTPIQSSVVNLLNNKQNLIASSETGSGKTLSYLMPIMHNVFLNKLKHDKNNKAVIILPTKELCMQIYKEALIYSNYYTKNQVKVKYMTKSMLDSIKTNQDNFVANNDIIVAIPTKALEIINILKENIIYLILDEADKFFDYGFVEIIDEVLFKLKDEASVCKGFFSATLVEEVQDIITTHIISAVKVSVGSNSQPARSIAQKLIYCTNEEGKLIGIQQLFKDGFEAPMLIFVEGMHRLRYLYDNIKFDMQKTSYLHSKMSKQEREDTVTKFRCGEIWV